MNKATPLYRPHEPAPAKDTYIAVDDTGEALTVAVLCIKGEKLPELAVLGSNPIGYVRMGEAVTTA